VSVLVKLTPIYKGCQPTTFLLLGVLVLLKPTLFNSVGFHKTNTLFTPLKKGIGFVKRVLVL
jgi:hypothetical protein